MQSPPLSFLNLTLLDPGALMQGAAAQVVESIQPLALGHLLCHLALESSCSSGQQWFGGWGHVYLGPNPVWDVATTKQWQGRTMFPVSV